MVVDGHTGVDPRVLRHQVTDLQQDVPCVPDVNGEAAVTGDWVLVRTLEGDGGFGSSTNFTAEDHGLSERTDHI